MGEYDISVCFSLVFDSGTAGFVYQTNEGFFGSFGCRLTAFCEPKCRPLVECVHDVSADNYTYATILGPTLSNNVDIVQPVARLPQMQVSMRCFLITSANPVRCNGFSLLNAVF